jgi:hypothetical protein
MQVGTLSASLLTTPDIQRGVTGGGYHFSVLPPCFWFATGTFRCIFQNRAARQSAGGLSTQLLLGVMVSRSRCHPLHRRTAAGRPSRLPAVQPLLWLRASLSKLHAATKPDLGTLGRPSHRMARQLMTTILAGRGIPVSPHTRQAWGSGGYGCGIKGGGRPCVHMQGSAVSLILRSRAAREADQALLNVAVCNHAVSGQD